MNALQAEPPEYNARIILDTATLRFDQGDGDASWIVANVVPTPGMGEARILRAIVDGATGKIVDLRTRKKGPAELVYREVGSWVLVAALEGEGCPERGTYDWNEPFGSPFRVTRMDLYDVFSDMNRGRRPGAGGGIIVTRYDLTEEGRKPFREVHLIPPAWHEAVKPAFDAFRLGEPLFAPTTARDTLLTVLQDETSPLAAVAAFRRLAEDVDPCWGDLQQSILASHGYLRAVFAYLALRHAPDESAAFAVLETVIERIDAMQGLRSIVAATGTAGFFSEPRSWMKDVTTRLRDEARARLQGIIGEQEMDPYLKRALYR